MIGYYALALNEMNKGNDMTLLLKTDIEQENGIKIPVIVEFSIDPIDESAGLMSEYACIESVLIHATKYYITDLLSDEVMNDLREECLRYHQEEMK